MTEHRARIHWVKESASFDYKEYNREHTWTFKNGTVVHAAAAPRFLGSEECVDPEEAFVASIASCHMLTFLALCSRKNIVVEKYDDDAVGVLEPNENKKLAITRVVLRPRITFAPGHQPSSAELQHVHDRAHEECFIANSVLTRVTVEEPAVGAAH
ncbi:MAG TPA: OsmC family protein [Candidatus Krumholzibacteria bacterium]|nr:OsmC family protein [Candidatus Krumholzibacteria bacterium]